MSEFVEVRVARRRIAQGVGRFVVLSSALLLLATGAAAATLSWSSAREVVLPTGGLGFYQGQFSSLACASDANCVASGVFVTKSSSVATVVDDERGGVWQPAQLLASPTNAAANSGLSVFGASCGGVGSCELVGNFQDASGAVEAFAAGSTDFHWSTPTAIALPANAPATESDAVLHSVSCASAGNCSAVGTYLDASSPYAHTLAMVVNENHGVWQRARSVTLPPDANANPLVNLSQVSCASAGNCSAVGSYVTRDGVTRSLVLNEVNGAWRAALAPRLPGDASAYAAASLSGLACASAGNCSAVGTYLTHTGATNVLSEAEVHGHWRRGQRVPLPPSAAANPQAFFYGFDELSCASAGNCATGGQFVDANGNYQGFLATQSRGQWRRATTLALPSGARFAGKNGGVVALSCPRIGECRAGAAFVDANGNYQALTDVQSRGVWSVGQRVTLPGGASTVGVDGGLYGLTCSSINVCSAIGSYLSGSNYQGFTITTP